MLIMLQWPEEIEQFSQWLTARGSLHRVLEIGTGPGGLTEHWCQLASDIVVSVDLPNGASSGLPAMECQARNAELSRLHPNFVGLLGDSTNPVVINRVRALAPFDLLFVDGDHSFLGVTADYENYRGCVRHGGVIAFHDIHADKYEYDGVRVPRFWRDLRVAPKYEFSVHGGWGGIGAIVV